MSLKLPKLPTSITRSVGRGSLYVRKYSPEILTTVGVVGVVTAAVLASKATLKLEPIVDAVKVHVDDSKEQLHKGEIEPADHTKRVAAVYTAGAVEIVKLYGPSVTMGLSSIVCIIAAHGIMRRRNVALVAAYKTLEETFARYRDRVVEELGEDQEREIRQGIREVEVKDEETGKTKIVKHYDPNGYSQYARFFDELNPNWSKEHDYNLNYIRCQQNFANDMLHARGHVFLNDVYDSLGIPRSSAGAVVGWVLSNDGDNFVDFGLFDPKNMAAREFVNGYESGILLDFNVDGTIFDKI